jgi:hypothetical protein
LSDNFPIQNGLKKRRFNDTAFQVTLDYAITKVQENQVGLKLIGTYQQLVYSDDIMNRMSDNIDNIKKKKKILNDVSKEVDLEVNTEKTKYMLLSHH